MGDQIFHEILEEVKALNQHLAKRLKENPVFRPLSEINAQKIGDELQISENNSRQALAQMSAHLKRYDDVIEFALKDPSKQNERLLQELKTEVAKLSVFLNPALVGMIRPNFAPIAEYSSPLWTYGIPEAWKYAENSISYTVVTNRAYYVTGYKAALGTSYDYLDDGASAEPVTAAQLKVQSDNAADAAGGTGVQSLFIRGLNSTFNRTTESLTMNGTTSVTTVNTYTYIDTVQALTVGTNIYAVGTITVKNAAGTITYGQIVAGEDNWRSGKFYVADEEDAFIDNWTMGSLDSSGVRAKLLAQGTSGLPGPLINRANVVTLNNSVSIYFPVPIRAPGPGLIIVRALAKASTAEATTSFQMHVEQEA